MAGPVSVGPEKPPARWQAIALGAVALLALALGLGLQRWLGMGQATDLAPVCDVGLSPCEANGVSASLLGRAVYTHDSRLVLTGLDRMLTWRGWIEGETMMMGFFPVKLVVGDAPGKTLGTFNLPICVTGPDMTWRIVLEGRPVSGEPVVRHTWRLSGVSSP